VCITGGEPTLSRELPELLGKIRAMGYSIKLDTNGYRPDVLRHLVEAGLVDYVAMDIKNSPARYALTVGLPDIVLERIEESIHYLLTGKLDYEFRTTVVKEFHDMSALTEIGRWLRDLAPENKANRYFLQSFTDRDSVLMAGLHSPLKQEMEAYAKILAPFVEQVTIRGVD
jgi:pyruvate formate lyase activating enzyme